MRLLGILAGILLLAPLAVAAAPVTFQRAAGESAQAFAARAMRGEIDPADVMQTSWNGQDVIFASRVVTEAPPENPKITESDRIVVVLRKLPGGGWQKLDVTNGEEEGGTASIAAIGFANADKDPAKELIVLLSWPVQHADVGGTLYEVRIFDDIHSPTQTELTLLKPVSDHFNVDTCDCDRDDAKPEHFRFKTIAAIKAELKRMGY
jgi:hypothetical protein